MESQAAAEEGETTPLLPTHEAAIAQRGLSSYFGLKALFGTLVLLLLAGHALGLPHATLVFSVFFLTVAGLLLTAVPVAVLVLTALLALTTANAWQCGPAEAPRDCSSLKEAFAVALGGFALPLSWLVWAAFNLGLAVELSGLGKRLSLIILKTFAKNPFSLGPGLLLIELVTALLIPSNTARGGALIFPLVVSISKTIGSRPMERYLVLCGFHANLLSSSAFFYGTVGNPVVAESAEEVFDIEFGFLEWAAGASIPVIVLFFLLPIMCYRLAGVDDQNYDSASIIRTAELELKQMGPFSAAEKAATTILCACLICWVFDLLPDGLTALIGLNAMMIVGVIKWDDIRDNGKAWDAFFWLAGMVLIVEQMNKMGLSRAVGDWCKEVLVDGMTPMNAAFVLGLFYFMSMYLFSSITSHLVALSTPLLIAGKGAGCPPMLITGLIAYFSGVSACLTSYSSGITVMYFSENAFSKKEWHLFGLYAAVLYFIVFATVGVVWWKMIGWW
ncbi:hypothetical protein HDU79_000055 [Rhizoclosmatium sp. JEL0117]|nr:hypothetical protein HDU79_000055 [Rhizoclosmatium sp. JEL0117]